MTKTAASVTGCGSKKLCAGGDKSDYSAVARGEDVEVPFKETVPFASR